MRDLSRGQCVAAVEHIQAMSDFYGVESDGIAVRAWSSQRLPYEPKGWLLDYREDLRRELRSLVHVDGAHLRAEYSSPDQAFSGLLHERVTRDVRLSAASVPHDCYACGIIRLCRQMTTAVSTAS